MGFNLGFKGLRYICYAFVGFDNKNTPFFPSMLEIT
jgi:hypothetical protein